LRNYQICAKCFLDAGLVLKIWRVKINEELDKLIKHKNIINYTNPSNAEL